MTNLNAAETRGSTYAAAPLAASQVTHHLSGEVYGYLPYWEVDAATDAYIRYDLLTDIALFSVGLNADGSISTSGGGYAKIVGATDALIVQHAHAAGVRVDLTVTSFGLAKNTAFFEDPAAMSAAATAIATFVTTYGLDGVSLDVESLNNVDFAAYGAFVGQVRAALQASNPIARVSVATNGSLSGAGMAVQALANGADRVFIMGYAYRSSGTSPAGSIDPITRTDGGKSLSWTLDLYASTGVPANRILLGLPYYGQSWYTTSGALHAPTTSSAGTFIPGTDYATVPSGTPMQYDLIEGSRWFAVQDPATGVWTETYVDDPSTLRTKYALVAQRGLAGIGIWTLGYDRGLPGYWDAIVGTFGTVRRAGPDWYATAAAVAADAYQPGVAVAYVATGAAFPDALAAAAAAGVARGPVLLSGATVLPTATLAELQALQPAKIVVVGGPSVISDAVLGQLATLAPGGAVRISGADRYGSAAALSAATFPGGAPIAYVTTGADFADAVSAAPAAARDGGPILLTRPTSLPAETLAELVRLSPAQVVIVGGSGAVSAAVEAAISSALPATTVTRLAGADRFATSAAVAATFSPGAPVVYAASGFAFPDALAAAAAAGAQRSPLLITWPTSLPGGIRDQILRLTPTRAVIAGGPSVVSDGVLAAIRDAVGAQ